MHFKLFLKLDHKEVEVRRFDCAENVNYEDFRQRVKDAFEHLPDDDFALKWEDEDGDKVSITNENEFQFALAQLNASTGTVRIDVEILEIPWWKQLQRSAQPFWANCVGEEHEGVFCHCCQSQLRGFRYKCLTCANVDICGACEDKGMHPRHDMIRISTQRVFPNELFDKIRRLYQDYEAEIMKNEDESSDNDAQIIETEDNVVKGEIKVQIVQESLASDANDRVSFNNTMDESTRDEGVGISDVFVNGETKIQVSNVEVQDTLAFDSGGDTVEDIPKKSVNNESKIPATSVNMKETFSEDPNPPEKVITDMCTEKPNGPGIHKTAIEESSKFSSEASNIEGHKEIQNIELEENTLGLEKPDDTIETVKELKGISKTENKKVDENPASESGVTLLTKEEVESFETSTDAETCPPCPPYKNIQEEIESLLAPMTPLPDLESVGHMKCNEETPETMKINSSDSCEQDKTGFSFPNDKKSKDRENSAIASHLSNGRSNIHSCLEDSLRRLEHSMKNTSTKFTELQDEKDDDKDVMSERKLSGSSSKSVEKEPLTQPLTSYRPRDLTREPKTTQRHYNPRIANALDQMLAMGFSDNDGWLTELLVRKHGDIVEVLEILSPVKK